VAGEWATVLVGATTAGAAIFGTWLTGRRTIEAVRVEQQGRVEADQADRDDRRSQERQERVRSFQFDNLIALQDALVRLARASGLADSVNRRDARAGVPLKERRLGDNVAEELRLATVEVNRLSSRVLDDRLRTAVENVRSHCVAIPDADTVDDARAQSTALAFAFEATMQALGAHLRTLV
jgi:hypothetical protein